MKKSKLLVICIALFSMMIFSSCAKYPQTEIDIAKTAISETKDLGADVYVPEAYQALVDSMTSVETKIEVKKSNFFKTYKNEKKSLITIGQMSTDVKAKTEVRKAELKAETIELCASVKALNESNKDLLIQAPKGKDGKEVLLAIANDIANIDAEIIVIDSLLNDGDIINSNNKIKNINEISLRINGELNEAISKVKK
jgi:PBP1b-binding outer membrane lipoprotein LpoB